MKMSKKLESWRDELSNPSTDKKLKAVSKNWSFQDRKRFQKVASNAKEKALEREQSKEIFIGPVTV